MQHPLAAVFRAISNTRRAPELLAAYGVVLYTPEHVELRSLLEDEKVREAIDVISGRRWVVFLGMLGPDAPEPESAMERLKETLRAALLGASYSSLVATFPMPRFSFRMWDEPDENALPLRPLGIDTADSLPCLLMLFPCSDEEAHALRIPLVASGRDQTQAVLMKSLSTVRDVLDGIIEANVKNAEGIRNEIARRLTDDKHKALLLKAGPFLSWAASKVKALFS